MNVLRIAVTGGLLLFVLALIARLTADLLREGRRPRRTLDELLIERRELAASMARHPAGRGRRG